ncbi:MAG TPA: ABC transporter ATP-binding protein [Thermoanaerobaculia bacterium]|nr:ABC transporter ATP-binding protein [Thermoanaerobaculia bacterium]
MSPNAISLDGLTVRYGKRTAVEGVSLGVAQGAVYALLGRNGAGKSSLVRCMLGQQKPSAGSATLFGDDAWSRRTALMDRIGIVAEEADAPPEMTVKDIAEFSARVYSRWNQQTVDDRLKRFGIPSSTKYGTLSKGQKKQVAVAFALAMSPELLVLDDPTLGLDVVARKSLYEEVIGELADRGITVFITTHDLGAVETIVDRVGILKNGQLVLDEEMETLKSRFRRIRFTSQTAALSGGTLVAASVRQWGSGTEAVVMNYDDVAFERFRSEANLTSADVAPLSLEEIFLAVAGENLGA